MPVGTRGKDKESESLFDKVRLLSPASQHGQGRSHGPLSTGLITPARSGTRPKQSGSVHSVQGHVDMTDIHQLILGVKECLDAHKQTVETQIIKLSESFHAHLDEKIELMGSDIKSHIKESIEDIQRYVDTEVGRITTQIEDVVTRVSASSRGKTDHRV